jgi:2-dehydro-3-deoxyphosphogluconate aldolase/(4S)-4-hydroxy-2-oxoglutarate aldolase
VRVVNFFPAQASGGLAMLRELADSFPEMGFVPSGEIDDPYLTDYLRLEQTLAVIKNWLIDSSIHDRGGIAKIGESLSQARAALCVRPELQRV